MIIAILILIYLVSVIGAYKTIQYYSYNKNGYYHGIDPKFIDFIFMITPVLNMLLIVLYWGVIHNYKDKINWNKFFNRW